MIWRPDKYKNNDERYATEEDAKAAAAKTGKWTGNDVKNFMWWMLMDLRQKPDVQALKECVYDLIGMITQKTGGQKKYAGGNDISFDDLDMTVFSIVVEAVALVEYGGI